MLMRFPCVFICSLLIWLILGSRSTLKTPTSYPSSSSLREPASTTPQWCSSRRAALKLVAKYIQVLLTNSYACNTLFWRGKIYILKHTTLYAKLRVLSVYDYFPVAIKYDPLFGDAFWNSSKYGMMTYILMMMTSWAIVCDVWYLPPMIKKDEEDAVTFANRVKAEIARQGGLVDLMW